ncbi:MAG: transglutaminase domain-containing protein, partial [Actinobacteria bacterium]|nr:transglutaminase domain-containing protein [Actinomycetota bacterium]
MPHLDRLAWRGAAAVLGVAAAVGIGAAAALDADDPWIDWAGWSWPGEDPSVGFRWNHSYGPLDWPRDGTALLRVESEEPHYWRVIQLDRFDGSGWEVATEQPSIERPLELPGDVEGRAAQGPPEPDWVQEVSFTIGGLESGLLLAPGAVLAVDGLDGVSPGAGGTSLTSERLRDGDTYTVTSYAPKPSAERLRASPASYPRALRRYTQLELPRSLPLPEAESGLTLSRPPTLTVPLYGQPRESRIAERLDESLYAGVHSLALRLSAGAESPYDAVAAIESHLRSGYSYTETPPRRPVPLRDFLFRDRAGYCQQFSGAMALMLRSLGIPSRVASGFSSGEAEQGGGAFQVSDRDAHSWVEAYFVGIGWVPFEPTPPAAPAGAQLSELAASRQVEATGTVIPRRGLVVPTVAGQLTAPEA